MHCTCRRIGSFRRRRASSICTAGPGRDVDAAAAACCRAASTLWLGPVGYFAYHGHAADLAEGERLANTFGNGRIVMMRGHGTITWGETIPQAFILNWILIRACENQLLAGGEELYRPDEAVIAKTSEQARSVTGADAPFGLQNWQAVLRRVDHVAPDYKT